MFDYVKKVFTSFIGRKNTEINREPRVIKAKEHGINPKQVSFAARKTCENLQARGFKAYIVGGAVRDLLLGVTPEQVKRAQRRAYIIGKRFRLVHVVFGQEIIECSTFRALDAAGQRKDASGRVISDNVFGEMWEDAARRDFTINALYYDPSSGDVLDYHNGFEDIKRKRLAMIGDPEERYREDPVRMMRAVRIATKLGFKIESSTERAIPKMAKNLENVPAARLFDEMMKLFTCGHAEACLIKLREEGLHRSLLPMLDVILKEKEGENFLMLALRRTDERIASGKKISPAFLFATLLWPQVLKRWEAYQTRPKMIRSKALYAAADDVIATQCAKLAIQNRFVADMKLIWMLQLRFERRTGKNPYSLIEHVKYRAGYDFMLLRSLLGQVPAEQVRWWEDFVEADADKRASMISQEEQRARKTGDKARAGNARRQEERFVADTVERLTEEQKPARLRQAQKNDKRRNDKRRTDRSSGRNLPVEVKTHLPVPTEDKTHLPQTIEPSVSRFDDNVEVLQRHDVTDVEIVKKPEEKLQQVETKKPTDKRRRTKKTPEVKPEETFVPAPEEGLIQIETDPAYTTRALDAMPEVVKTVTEDQSEKSRKTKTTEAKTSETVEESEKTQNEAPKKRTRKSKVKDQDAVVAEVAKPKEISTESSESVVEVKPKKRVARKKKSDQTSEAVVQVKATSEITPEVGSSTNATQEETVKVKVAVKRTRKAAKVETPQSAQAVSDVSETIKPEVSEKKPRRTKKAQTEDATLKPATESKPKRRTRTVKKAAEAAAVAPVEEEIVSPTARRKPVRKKSALTHTAPKNND